jgi:6-pyruvoyltetrahydropterin/6-carboxytetrahydropterin synthase
MSTDNQYNFELSQRFYFESAHTLNRDIEVAGSKRIHGHTYESEITLSGTKDAMTGMVIDIGELKRSIEIVKSKLDHRFLNEIHELGPPTLENLCVFIKNNLITIYPNLKSVLVERKSGGDKCVLFL